MSIEPQAHPRTMQPEAARPRPAPVSAEVAPEALPVALDPAPAAALEGMPNHGNAGGLRRTAAAQLQRQAGNQYVQRLLKRQEHTPPRRSGGPTVQAKLVVNEPGDAYEQEADRVAESVIRMPAISAASGDEDGQPGAARSVQRSGGKTNVPEVTPQVEAEIDRVRQGGEPMPPEERTFFEERMGADFSRVRLHTDGAAAQTAQQLGARAYTTGADIAFNRGEFQPGSPAGRRLLAHELTHVIQQGAAKRSVARRPQHNVMRLVAQGATISATTHQVQLLPDFITSELNDYARHIPGYTLFTVIVGFNPLTGNAVPRTAVSLLEGLMGLVPFGTLVFDALQRYNLITPAFEWVEGELGRLNLSISRIEQVIEAAWEEVELIEGFDFNLAILERHFLGLLNDVKAFAESLVDHIITMIREAVVSVAEELLADNKAWALIKKILHYDPLRGEAVDATTVEILEDFLMLIGKQTELEQMKARGTLQKTADWLDTQIGSFRSLLVQLQDLFQTAWDAIQPQNLPDLPVNLRSIVQQATSFLQDVWTFASTVALKVLELIKDALLGWLSEYAHEIPGFHLLTVILGKNPFTQVVVPRTAENIIKGFITLLPGGEAKYNQMAETGKIGEAAQRIEGAMESLGINWGMVTGLFTGIWEGLSIDDVVNPVDAFQRIMDQFGEPIGRLFSFIQVVVREIFSLILEMMNFPSDIVARIINNAMQAFEDIKKDPVGFFNNMLQAVKLGFSHFFDNILQHLLSGLSGWLFGQIEKAGITPPQDLSLGSILDMVLQILGITMENIWQKLGERIGPENVARIRGAIDRLTGIWTFIRDVQERGMAAIWEHIQSQISNLWNMVLEKAQEWIITEIIQRVVIKLLSMLDPTGIMAVVNSFIAFFNAVQSAIEYIREILMIVDDYVSTIASVAQGNVEPGAQKMEGGLASSIPVAIGFLANQVGLGNIADKIVEIIGAVREYVDMALDWLLDRAVNMGRGLLSSLGLGGDPESPAPNQQFTEEDRTRGLEAFEAEEKAYLQDEKITQDSARQVAANVREKHPVFASIAVVDGGDDWEYEYVFRQKKSTRSKKAESGIVSISLARPSFWPSTRETLAVRRGQHRRHIVPFTHFRDNYHEALNGLTYERAAKKIEDHFDIVVVRPLTNDTIRAAAMELLRGANNDQENLWVGAGKENVALGNRYYDEPHDWTPQMRDARIRLVERYWFLPV